MTNTLSTITFGFIRPDIDVHTLGISSVTNLIRECGYRVVVGDAKIAKAVANLERLEHISLLTSWLQKHKITHLGFSYRLDPQAAQDIFGKLYHQLKDKKQFQDQGGNLQQIYFSGLPESCRRIKQEYDGKIPVFLGDETLTETAFKLGIPNQLIPVSFKTGSKYDEDRMQFAKQLVTSGNYNYIEPNKRFNYHNFGTKQDTLIERLKHNKIPGYPPLMRVHVGPYNHDYTEAKKEFISWLKILSETQYLDIVSIGSSQLSQSDFGKEWGNKPNGGGVPINTEQDLIDIYNSSRPMLVRTYAGTRNIPALAKVYEKTINMAWHALSFWWFNQIDGRGPNSVQENLKEHIETLAYIATTGKPFEPNIPHHFAFRGSDDYSYVLSAIIAAKMAKKLGVEYMVLQIMLNTPKYTWGVQDIAKARALYKLAKSLENKNFKIILQPRAGLDYFSPDLNKARIQLAAVTAMMDDIDPKNQHSPEIIHVVSYCEAVKLADPNYINESIQITTSALAEYRRQKTAGHLDNMINNIDVEERMQDIINEVTQSLNILENRYTNLYSPDGLYKIFKDGVFPIPYLWEGRSEFNQATRWKTGIYKGGIYILNDLNQPIKPSVRLSQIKNLMS
jgi:hypothetical protein